MSKIRVLSDHLANQIAAGEVVERPASVAKELVENAIDADATRIDVDVAAGGRRLLRVADDGVGMTRDDAVLAFERHATSKISTSEDLSRIRTLGFRGEALASIASVARVELLTQLQTDSEGTRVLIEGGRMRDVAPAARPAGTTVTVKDLFFNVPARRKFLRSEATESFHLTNLVTHYSLAHPEIAFTLTNNGREVLRAAQAADLRERAYQIFGREFIDNLLEVDGGHAQVARVRGFVSAPRERRTSRDAQFLFVNGRFVRDRLIARALTEGYRSVLPHGVFPAALLFLEIPLEEVDVNVHPAKTEVRFRRAAAVADVVRDAVRSALAAGGFFKHTEQIASWEEQSRMSTFGREMPDVSRSVERDEHAIAQLQDEVRFDWHNANPDPNPEPNPDEAFAETGQLQPEHNVVSHASEQVTDTRSSIEIGLATDRLTETFPPSAPSGETRGVGSTSAVAPARSTSVSLPPLNSAASLVREVAVESVSRDIRPLGQLDESFIIATDPHGLLLIDQHVAHERILFDKYRRLESSRPAEAQNLLVPETFDLSPAQAAAFDVVCDELEHYGFSLSRLSGRTVAVRAVPADLPPGEARNLLAEILDTVDAEKRGQARETLRDEIAASLACRAAIKINMALTDEKMRWLIDRLLLTSSPTTCPHGRPVILRLTKRDIEKGFHRP